MIPTVLNVLPIALIARSNARLHAEVPLHSTKSNLIRQFVVSSRLITYTPQSHFHSAESRCTNFSLPELNSQEKDDSPSCAASKGWRSADSFGGPPKLYVKGPYSTMLLPKNPAKLAFLLLGSLLPLAVAAAPISGGSTTVVFNPATLNTLTSAGFSIAPVSPATLATSPGVSASFPITGGDTTSVINHSGGLSLTRSGTTANLLNFAINVPGSTLFGQVTSGSTTLNNVALFDITMSGGNTNLAVSSALSGAISTVFGPGVSVPAGTPIGTATVNPVPEPASLALAGFSLLAGGYAFWRKSRKA